jgi:hypothetical protein
MSDTPATLSITKNEQVQVNWKEPLADGSRTEILTNLKGQDAKDFIKGFNEYINSPHTVKEQGRAAHGSVAPDNTPRAQGKKFADEITR